MTNSLSNSQKNLNIQLGKLRKLAQPFFLPLDQAKGWQFIWLLVCLLFCVGGLVLVAVTGIIEVLEKLQPDLIEKYFSGVVRTIRFIWSSSLGWLFSGLFLIGAGSFFRFRHQLKSKRWLHLVRNKRTSCIEEKGDFKDPP